MVLINRAPPVERPCAAVATARNYIQKGVYFLHLQEERLGNARAALD